MKYLIVQKSNGKVFCYFENDENHHLSSEKARQSSGFIKLDPVSLVNDACLDNHGDNFYIVFVVN